MSTRAAKNLAGLLLTLVSGIGFARGSSGPACTNAARQQPAIVADRTTLERTPRALATRLNLASLLFKTECYDDALYVLEDGERYNPHNPFLKYYLERARKMKKEGDLGGLDQAQTAAKSPNNKQHEPLLKRCTEENGEAALQACLATLAAGAPNKFDITLRIAALQQSADRPYQALDSYIAADSLRHGNKEVALAILALLDVTKRKDGVALAARGSSLITLGRAGEAVASLRQARALAPGLPDIDKQLASAEALARAQSPRRESQPRVVVASAADAAAEAVPEPRSYSNAEPASRSN